MSTDTENHFFCRCCCCFHFGKSEKYFPFLCFLSESICCIRKHKTRILYCIMLWIYCYFVYFIGVFSFSLLLLLSVSAFILLNIYFMKWMLLLGTFIVVLWVLFWFLFVLFLYFVSIFCFDKRNSEQYRTTTIQYNTQEKKCVFRFNFCFISFALLLLASFYKTKEKKSSSSISCAFFVCFFLSILHSHGIQFDWITKLLVLCVCAMNSIGVEC